MVPITAGNQTITMTKVSDMLLRDVTEIDFGNAFGNAFKEWTSEENLCSMILPGEEKESIYPDRNTDSKCNVGQRICCKSNRLI